MHAGPLSEFRDAITHPDPNTLAAYLKERFPADPNAACFDALAGFACGRADDFPALPALGEQDRHFVDMMLRAGRRRRLGREAVPDRRILEIGPELDFLEHTCLPHRLSPLQMLGFAMQIRRRPARQVALVLMARDEGIYLPEWLAHYRLLGAEHVFVYTNDNADGSDPLLHALASRGSITLIDTKFAPGVNPQRKEYQHALLLLDELRDYRWALFIDADEFLNFHTDDAGALRTFITAVEQRFCDRLPDAVVFPWNWRFTDRAFSRAGVSLLDQYPHAALHGLTKSLVNLGSALAMCEVHIPTLDENGVMIDGAMRTIDRSHVWSGVQRPYAGPVVEHYWAKSFVEFLVKKRRGDHLDLKENLFRRDYEQFFAWTGIPSRENLQPVSQAWIGKVRQARAELLADPQVKSRYDVILDRHWQAIAELSGTAQFLGLYDEYIKSVAPSL